MIDIQSDRQNIMYLRTAHKEKNKIGISAQRDSIFKYRQTHPELPEHFVEIIDDGYSGFDDDAPGIQKILQLIRTNKIAFLLVSDLSRLSRDPRKTMMYVETLFPSHDVNFIITGTVSNDSV